MHFDDEFTKNKAESLGFQCAKVTSFDLER